MSISHGVVISASEPDAMLKMIKKNADQVFFRVEDWKKNDFSIKKPNFDFE